MTTFLFSNVVVSGIRILAYMRWTRRERFIVSVSGLTVLFVHLLNLYVILTITLW